MSPKSDRPAVKQRQAKRMGAEKPLYDRLAANDTSPHRYVLRLPRSLFAELEAQASDEGVSVNTLIVAALAGATRWRQD